MLLPSRKMRPLGPVLCLLGLLIDTHPVAAQSRLVREYVYAGDRLLATVGEAVGQGTAGFYRPSTSTFYLHGQLGPFGKPSIPPFVFGQPGDIPIVGDWDGDGVDTVGVYRPAVATFYLRNSNTSGPADIIAPFGSTGDMPLAGDWDANGVDTIGVYRPSTSTFYLRNSNSPGPPDITPFVFGLSGDIPLAGDWNGDGIDTIAAYRSDVFHLRNSNTAGPDDAFLEFAPPAGTPAPPTQRPSPLAGDWNRDGIDGVGVFTRQVGYGYWLADLPTATTTAVYYPWLGALLAQAGDVPVGGDFDGIP